MFEGLSDRLQNAFKKLRGQGVIKEEHINEALREVRMALLEADVNFKVVKDFTAKVKEKALGQQVIGSLSAAQQVIKIVNDELAELMGGTQSKLLVAQQLPTVIMLVGLQGAGKTTTAGKLAAVFKKQGKKPLLVAGDVYRPAAIKQLEVVAEQVGVSFYSLPDNNNPVEIARNAVAKAESILCDTVIIDTAGRLHINEELMDELQNIKKQAMPHEILLVVDAMIGQESVTVAESFHTKLGLTGLILTKLDGDARGGAALSIKAVTGCPIKYVGMGEKLDALEPFHPDRMASRILGMGDVLSLIEKVQSTIDMDQAAELEKKLRKDEFTLEQFLEQLQMVKKMGSLGSLLDMIPGLGSKMKELKDAKIDEKELAHTEAIIRSMTPKERRNPDILNGSRRKRIALGSGTKVQDVNRLIKQFDESRKMMKKMQSMQKMGKKGFKLPFM